MSLRTTRERAFRMAAQLGATVEHYVTGSLYTILIDAPEGQQWVDGGCLGMRIEGRPTCGADREAMWQNALDRMGCGLIDELS